MVGQAFPYIPLNSQLQEIRVLELSPGSLDEPVCCRLYNTSLSSTPIYNALSYVWGDAASSNIPGNVIMLDGDPFPVTTNLLSALRHLRPPAGGKPMRLWVDAVCINQGDLDERSQQVAMMRDVYASAERVVIWLGEDGDGSNAAFDAMLEIGETNRHRGDATQDGNRLVLMRQCSSFFVTLVDRPWFSRVWILQELAMAKKDPLVVCGSKAQPWSLVIKVWNAIAKEMVTEIGMVREEVRGESRQMAEDRAKGVNHTTGDDATGADDDGIVDIITKTKIDILDELLAAMRSAGGESLRKLLLISRTSEATDPRDKIYALLGLLNKKEMEADSSIPIHVDYRQPTSVVYADAVSHIFSRGDGPYLLSGVFLPGVSADAPRIDYLPPTTQQPKLPSWVPDFSRQVGGKATQPSGMVFHPPAGISVSGPGADCQNGKVLEDNRTLQVEGLMIDTIEQIIAIPPALDLWIDKLAEMESVALNARQRPSQFGSSILPLMDKFKNKEPLWRILISNKRFMSGYEAAPSSYGETYQSLLSKHVATVDPNNNLDGKQRSEYERCLELRIGHISVFVTKGGFIGTCVPDSRVGDVAAIIFGSPVPFILRPPMRSGQVQDNARQTYSLIGASYVGGIMSGEMVDELYCEDLMDSTTFFIG